MYRTCQLLGELVQSISKFEISNLFGTKNISLSISENAIILVGPNGIGKSSVANIFYFFMSRQWSRLLEYSFSELSIQIDNQTIVARREDITGVDEVNKQLRGISPDTKAGRHLAKLMELGSRIVLSPNLAPRQHHHLRLCLARAF